MKGQIDGKVIIFALIALGAGLVLLFGISNVKKVAEVADDAQLSRFQSSLVADIASTLRKGKVKVSEYAVPAGVAEVCFLNVAKSNPNGDFAVKAEYPLVAHSAEGSDERIFLLTGKKEILAAAQTVKIGKVLGSGLNDLDSACYVVRNGKLGLRIEGLGSLVVISAITP